MTTATTMLLRSSSSSSSVLNSWLSHSTHSASPEPETLHQISRARSISLSASSSPRSPIEGSPINSLARVMSETDLSPTAPNLWVAGSPSRTSSFGPALLSFSELEECDGAGAVAGGGGGAGGKNDGGGPGFWDSNNDNDITDVYYRAMIESNPRNPIFLGNYARYLKEVRGDYVKAEEYFGRAILVDPNDGSMLSMYADLIWECHKDAPRAECYFDQAIKAAPDDCYVLASYAHFLWDTEDDDVVEEDFEQPPSFFHGTAPPAPPTLAAAA